MQFIGYNKENHSILNQIYDTPAELQAKDKKITLCKHCGNKEEKDVPRVLQQDYPTQITT